MRQNILLIRFSSLGDVALTSAAVVNLRINYPGSRILFLTKERFAPVVEMMHGVDEVITIPDVASIRELAGIVAALERKRIDLLIDLHGNFRSRLVGKLITASQKLLYPKRRREREAVVREGGSALAVAHTIDAYNSALSEAGMITPCIRPQLSPSRAKIETVWTEEDSDTVRVLVAPGAAHGPKRWPIAKFAELAHLLDQTGNVEIVWVLADDEEHILAPVKSSLPGKQMIGRPLAELATMISQASITISNDSGVAHLSSGLGTPAVVLFGPTHSSLGFAPRGLFDRMVETDEECRPCSLHGSSGCYREEQFCFTRILPPDVLAAIDQTLETAGDLRPAVFVDRDGTIIAEKHFLSDPEQVEVLPGSVEGLKKLSAAGCKIVIVSNQSGVARGYFDVSQAERVNARLLEILQQAGVSVDGLYFCPHYPDGNQPEYARRCDCRKPSVGMVETAARQLRLDLRSSYVIGDKMDDCNLALAMGGRPLLVRTGHGLDQMKRLPPELIDRLVVDDLAAAAERIVRPEN
ncbi:MAG: HAD-IIIA family hydrolase [bacterium]|nr:HAD-IIIA family hydrolase [bacterium]